MMEVANEYAIPHSQVDYFKKVSREIAPVITEDSAKKDVEQAFRI